MKLVLLILLAGWSTTSFAQLPCSNKNTIDFASALAISESFERAQQGMDILLSLQSKDAKIALGKLKIEGEAMHEVWSDYTEHYDQKPKIDNANDEITYYNCSEIKKLMSKMKKDFTFKYPGSSSSSKSKK